MSSDFRKRVDDMLKVQTRVFGEQVVYYPSSGGVFKINGIFDNAYQAVDPDTEEVISANQSVLGINLNDIKDNEISKDDKFKIRNMEYRVIDSQEDGQGGSMILLQKVRNDEKVNLRKYKRRS